MAELDRIIAREPEKPAKRPAGHKNRPLPMNRRSHNEMCPQCSTRFCDHVMAPVAPQWARARLLIGLLHGWSNLEIAEKMKLEEGSVKVYITLTCRDFGLTSRLELALWAYERRAYLEAIVARGKRRCANF